jgi:hypothetical protein
MYTTKGDAANVLLDREDAAVLTADNKDSRVPPPSQEMDSLGLLFKHSVLTSTYLKAMIGVVLLIVVVIIGTFRLVRPAESYGLSKWKGLDFSSPREGKYSEPYTLMVRTCKGNLTECTTDGFLISCLCGCSTVEYTEEVGVFSDDEDCEQESDRRLALDNIDVN